MMLYKLISPSMVKATIQLPASKSISNRALIINALGKGIYPPENLSDCDDTQVMIKALTEGKETIDIMAAGTAMRFLTAYLSATSGERIITGTARMQQRPIQILVNALRELGAEIEYTHNEGYPPLRIKGAELKGNEITLKGNVSSQYISALLMIGAVLPQGLRLHLTGDIISRPYINLTLQLMRDFGAQADWASKDCITVSPGGYTDTPFTVESDWSAASYWYQMMAIEGIKNEKIKMKGGDRSSAKESEDSTKEEAHTAEIELLGLFAHSYQGDSRGAEVFARLGVHTEYTDRGVKLIRKGTPATRLDEDMVDIPDLAQTFVVTCCLMDIPFRFTGLQSLKIKETDRITALITELRKLGYVVRSEQDSILLWDGERCPADADPVIATYEDHRMAMAFAPACLVLPQIQIDEPQVVTKSYPAYWEDLQKAGFKVCQNAMQS